MIVTYIGLETINSIILPEKIKGQFLLSSCATDDEHDFSIEAANGKWILKAPKKLRIIDKAGQAVKSSPLNEDMMYISIDEDGNNYCIFTQANSEGAKTYTKYVAVNDLELTVGRSENCDIVFDNGYVSSCHATLKYSGGKWSVFDNNSRNGTFVNQKRVEQTELYVGDTVYIMGMKLIAGRGLIAINDPDGKVKIVTNRLKIYQPQAPNPIDDEDEREEPKQEYFYRSPRFKRDIESATFKVDSPPNSPIGEEMPWILVMGSSLAMGAMSATSMASAIMAQNYISMVMAGSMLIGTVLLPMITKKVEKKRKLKKEAERQQKYKEYLAEIQRNIKKECHNQTDILNENHITIGECEERILHKKRNLWERGPSQNDFLELRVGHGDGLLDANIQYSERRFSVTEDNLQEEMYELCEKPKALHNIPITFSLYDNYISGVIGQRNKVVDFAKGLIFQIASLYSYDEVKLVFIYDEAEEEELEFVKWLPHVWSDDEKFRFIATNQNEVKEVSAYLENIIEVRSEMNGEDLKDESPYYIIFSLSQALSQKAEALKQLYSKKENLNISVLNFYDELKNLPKECSFVVELAGGNGKLFDKNDISGKSVLFAPDISLTEDPDKLSVALANIRLDKLAGGYLLPSTITFLEMFGVGKIEHLNALTRWKENDPTKSLQAEVGVDTYGELFKLDLHERFHGPHGLVAGMTGSGKSEFIITYILSLAVNYHPDEVAFILIDYKGGGMAKSFEKLPHVAGIITNLDGAAIQRSLISIESELKRRQAIFGEAGKKIGVSNIDIYKYQKLYREGRVSEPLQHLFIISDEFAELKTQQPEFMTQLISAARIGRSLGVHLILATQKPSGVVDDQIWSNSKFRVCLKVQERADSMDMLKRADAAELTDTGRFYLQVGYNELFELGQSAWSGAPYYPADKVQKEIDDSVVIIDHNGHILKETKFGRKGPKDAPKQLDAITEYLRSIADEENIKVRPLWLEPISGVIVLDELKKKYPSETKKFLLNPVIGEYDDPARQRQCLLRLPISEEGNTVVYGAATAGKTSFLNALAYSLITEHTPEEVNLYLLDFASETMRAFARAPHVGDVILSYEGEKVSNLFKLLLAEIERRKKLFTDFGGDYASYIAASGESVPNIVVMINNFAAFTELYPEKEEAIQYLSREGTKYGVYFILTALGTSTVRFRLMQNFKQLIALQMNDESDYSTIVGKTEGLLPSKFKGRGLIRKDSLYEFQTAFLCRDDNPYGFIRSECDRIREGWQGEAAKKVPVLPKKVDKEFLEEYYSPAKKNLIPIGIEKGSLNIHYLPIDRMYITAVLSESDGHIGFMSDLADFIKDKVSLTVIDGDGTSAQSSDKVAELFEDVLYRNNTYKEAEDKRTVSDSFEERVVLIPSLGKLLESLDETGREKLRLVLEKGAKEYRIYIIFSDRAKSMSGYAYEKWYKSNVSQSDGVWVGSGISDQYQLKLTKTAAEHREDIPVQFGYSVIGGKSTRVKLLCSLEEVEEDDE